MSDFSISIRPFGVHAILVEWPNKVHEGILNDILKFTNYLETKCLDVKKWELVPAYNSITLILRKEPIDFDRLIKRLRQWHEECGESKPKQKYLWKLPVCYDLDFGIDLEEVSETLSLDIEEVIKQHTENVFTVFGIGFLPGFMYLGGLPKSLEVPRRATPRLKVQKGSVGLASKQTGIYPQESPGGWNIIGNCAVPMFNPKDENPCFVSVGDRVQFYAIERAEYDLRKIEGEVGIYKLEKRNGMLKILKSGFFTSIQDAGRFGYLNKGVPVSGYMDSFSAAKLNKLLDNPEDAAVMEVTMTGPTLLFEEQTYICLGGADISVTLNNNPIEQYKVYKIEKGDIISYGSLQKGFRNYLAIKNGFKCTPILESRSFYYPLTEKSHLNDHAELAYDPCKEYNAKITELKVDSFLDEEVLHVAIGPEFGILTDKQLEQLFSKDFSVAKDYNRMAYQLEESIAGHSHSMLTSATLPGTIQITPLGKLIVLMKDGQTTGGYPRILQLTDKAISILAQKKYGDTVSFKLAKG